MTRIAIAFFALAALATTASAQDATTTSAPQASPEAVRLADEYARQRVEDALTRERDVNRQRRKRWLQMVDDADERLASAEDRLDKAAASLQEAGRDDPEVRRLGAEVRSRIDRAERWVGRWADVEELPQRAAEGFAAVLGKGGVQVVLGGAKQSSAELVPPAGSDKPEPDGWLLSALNSDAAAGAGGTTMIALLLLALKRMRDKDKEDADERNDSVTEQATLRALLKLQQQQQPAGGSGTAGRP